MHGHDIDLLGGTISTLVKGKKERILPLHPAIAELAKRMPPDDWWFPGRRGDGPLRPASVTEAITPRRSCGRGSSTRT